MVKKQGITLLYIAASLMPLGCFNPTDSNACRTHCYEHRPQVEDLNGDGRFDAQCVNAGGDGDVFAPPLPPSSFFLARACTETQQEHERLKSAINAILSNEELSHAELTTYQAMVDDLAQSAFTACRNHLLGDNPDSGGFTPTDIDPTLPGTQWCAPGDADDICDAYVRAVVIEDLQEVLNGGNMVPIYSEPGVKFISSGVCDFVPELGQADTDTGGESDTAPTSDTDGGTDTEDSSTGAGADDPWGDLRGLVSCNKVGSCTVERELLDNVTQSFSVFYDEGATMLFTKKQVTGIKISGLDRGEASTELAAAFGVRDGDIVTEVNGFRLDTEESTSLALQHLSTQPSPIEVSLTRKTPRGIQNFQRTLRFVE